MVERGEKNTFSDQVFTTFNDLPKAIRQKSILQRIKKIYIDRALARTLFL